ncbi:MAG: Gfo/Idh/MocA family oxidoreductase [Phycisphaeraceae bacterium]|nr:Gfo/Idh/MocA family oxidoreductase [Phycisphaeraceae bacterium]
MPDSTNGTNASSDGKNGRTLRCGAVGVGRMGQHHARVYATEPGCELVGVVDSSPDRAAEIAKKFNCRAFPTEQALLDAGVDAVSIAVPTTAHYKSAEPFLKTASRVSSRSPSPLTPRPPTPSRTSPSPPARASWSAISSASTPSCGPCSGRPPKPARSRPLHRGPPRQPHVLPLRRCGRRHGHDDPRPGRRAHADGWSGTRRDPGLRRRCHHPARGHLQRAARLAPPHRQLRRQHHRQPPGPQDRTRHPHHRRGCLHQDRLCRQEGRHHPAPRQRDPDERGA